MGTRVTPRKYIIRVTRHPLTPEQILALAIRGELPTDYADRSVLTTDFVEVEAADDVEAVQRAHEITRLKNGGETFEFHEANGPEFRPLEHDVRRAE